MKKNSLRLFFLMFALPLVCLGKGGGGGNKNKPAPPDTRVLITSIDESKQTIVITDKKANTTVTYAVGPQTSIELNGSSATFKDLKSGLQVRSTQLDTGSSEVPVLIDLDVKTADPAPTPPGKNK